MSIGIDGGLFLIVSIDNAMIDFTRHLSLQVLTTALKWKVETSGRIWVGSTLYEVSEEVAV
jgi:hypothetical protein